MGRFSVSQSRHSKSRMRRRFGLERLERRDLMAADPLPVLMVLADQRDFYYREYGETRIGLEAEGMDVVVAARTTNPTVPHPGTGETGSGQVIPDIALANVNAADYSAIVFVGGWGSSMYQYAYPGDYQNNHYDGDPATKTIVNDLIGDFIEQDKYVTAICHGVTVLAWARVDGVSPLNGKTVSVPWIGSPATLYEGQWYGSSQLMQYPQVVANGATANTGSGQYGNPSTVADDVYVDGRIITAENFDAALQFGHVIGQQVNAAADDEEPPPPVNNAPVLAPGEFELAENAALGTPAGMASASDADAGQSLTYAIVGGNTGGAFAIDPLTGQISVANAAAVDFETTPVFNLLVEVADNGESALSDAATIVIALIDEVETPPSPVNVVGADLVVQGTPASDTIYIRTDHSGRLFAWMNGQMWGPYTMPAGGRAAVYAGDGNDQVYATDSHLPVSIDGEGGHDQITGGFAGDLLDGGDGVDRIWAMQGNDIVRGGAGNDFIDGREGNDVVLGGDGDDAVGGLDGYDLLIGGAGADRMDGGSGDDLLIAGSTSYDDNDEALLAILAAWMLPADLPTRSQNLMTGLPDGTRLAWGETVFDDALADCLNGNTGTDWLFLLASDHQCYAGNNELVTG